MEVMKLYNNLGKNTPLYVFSCLCSIRTHIYILSNLIIGFPKISVFWKLYNNITTTREAKNGDCAFMVKREAFFPVVKNGVNPLLGGATHV